MSQTPSRPALVGGPIVISIGGMITAFAAGTAGGFEHTVELAYSRGTGKYWDIVTAICIEVLTVTGTAMYLWFQRNGWPTTYPLWLIIIGVLATFGAQMAWCYGRGTKAAPVDPLDYIVAGTPTAVALLLILGGHLAHTYASATATEGAFTASTATATGASTEETHPGDAPQETHLEETQTHPETQVVTHPDADTVAVDAPEETQPLVFPAKVADAPESNAVQSAKIPRATDDLEAKVEAVLEAVRKPGQRVVKDGVVSERKVQEMVGGGRAKVKAVAVEVGRRLAVERGGSGGVGSEREGGTPLHHDRIGPSDASGADPETPRLRAVKHG